MSAQFEDMWRDAKRYRIEEFKPFGVIGGVLWAPALIRDRWRILELHLDVARDGASQVFSLVGNGANVVSLVHAALKRRDRPKALRA